MNKSEIYNLFSIFYEIADERIRDKFLMGSPYAIIIVYLFYIVFIEMIFKKFMKNRKSQWNYRKLMSYLDVLLVIRAVYFLTYATYGWFFVYNWICQPLDRNNTWISKFELKLCHEFLITKFLYTFQSVIFVLCKKRTSVGYYLLIHHTIFPIMLWIGVNYYPGGHVTFIGFINSFVHLNTIIIRLVVTNFTTVWLKKHCRSLHVGFHVSFVQFCKTLKNITLIFFADL